MAADRTLDDIGERETCDQCRFDSDAYPHADLVGTLSAIEPWWRLLTAPVEAATLRTRPAADTWSALEYCTHSELVVGLHAAGLELLAGGGDVHLPPFAEEDAAAASPVAAGTTISSAIAGLARNVALVRVAYLDAADRRLANSLTVAGDMPRSAGGLTRHALHDTLHHLQDVGRGLATLGAGAPRQSGTVVQVHAGGGGVPKPAVECASVGFRGVQGDVQAIRLHHGRVWQAVCFASMEAIERFRADGHSLAPGSAGENFTLAGIDFTTLRPGTRVRVGSVLCELSLPAVPCAKNAQWFSDGDFGRMHHERDPASTRWYARVLEDGDVRAGDAAEVEPA